jgi:carboxyl-terminal processing protease
MPNKKRILWGAAAALIIVIIGGGGFAAGYFKGQQTPKRITVSGVKNLTSTSTAADFGTFWEAWNVINDKYLRATSTKDQTKVEGAISGLVSSLGDPYSEYFTPQGAKTFLEDVEGSFSGIGAEIGMRRDQIVIIAPLKDSPAMQAGLKADDQIISIDATSTDALTVDRAVSYIRGKEGTTVKLTILREGWQKPKEFSIVRKQIDAPTLDYKMLPDNIAYIQLYGFNANADRLFADAARQATAAGAKGMILDLRGNPGGYLDVAVNLAGWFLPQGTVVVKEATRDGIVDQLKAEGNASLANLPVVVLIDKGSASASEILSGALRDQRKIKLIGETSFGKGTVQEFQDLADGSVIKLTIAHWVLPSGRILDHDGLVPDYPVKITDADASAKKDPQLDKAAEVLKGEIK